MRPAVRPDALAAWVGTERLMHDLADLVLAAHTSQHTRLGALVTEASQLDALQACGVPGDWGALVDRRRGDLAHEALALLVRWSRIGGSIGLAHALVAADEAAANPPGTLPTGPLTLVGGPGPAHPDEAAGSTPAQRTTWGARNLAVDDEAGVHEVDSAAWQARRVAELRARFLTGGDCDPSPARPEDPDALPSLGRGYDNDDAEEPPECFMEFTGLEDDDDDDELAVAAPTPEAVAWHAEQRARTTVVPFEVPLEALVADAQPAATMPAGSPSHEGAPDTTGGPVPPRSAVASAHNSVVVAAARDQRPASLESVEGLAAFWGGAPRKRGDTSHFARLAPSVPSPAKAPAACKPPPPPPVARASVAATVPLEEDDDPPTDEAPPSVPTDWPGFAHTRGKRALMVGGDPREPNRLRLAGAFGFSELEWFPAEFSRNSLQRARDRVRSGGWDMVILLSRFVGHDADNVIQPACKLRGVPFVPVATGYGVTGVRRAIERHVLGMREG